ncbi:pyridoxal-phosphate dependent enzyme [Cryomorphaceae bacterium 1068]|nr:pyridoxal-phosphate dependent enzyme [Cryomorphaceae bacterium 1068]
MNRNRLLAAHDRIRPFIHHTPVLTSTLINELVGAEVFFKCENFQKMGAFKMRGATNAVLQLTDEQRSRGVVTHSSGNHGQALALAARSIGVKAYIVMPANAPQVKKDAVSGYGGIITECEATLEAREAAAAKITSEKGATFIHPSNDLEVIIGQGTSAKELLEEYPQLNAIFAPIGGGGLIAGTALAAEFFGTDCKVYGGEPMEADDAFRSLQSGKIETNETANTIADGLRTNLGDQNFPIIQKGVERIIRVSEVEIVDAMRLIWTRLKIVCEPSCAVPLAALIKEKEQFQHQKIGIIITGGNVDLNQLPFGIN